VRPGTGNFSLRHRVQTGSGARPASYPTGTGGFSLGVKRQGREVAEVKECVEVHLDSLIRLHGVVFS
jgi:hypothetical protein